MGFKTENANPKLDQGSFPLLIQRAWTNYSPACYADNTNNWRHLGADVKHYESLRTGVVKMDSVLEQIIEISLQYKVDKTVLFGSRARGDNSLSKKTLQIN